MYLMEVFHWYHLVGNYEFLDCLQSQFGLVVVSHLAVVVGQNIKHV